VPDDVIETVHVDSGTNDNLTPTGDNATNRLIIDEPDGSSNQLTVDDIVGESVTLDQAEINDLLDTDRTAVEAVAELTDNLDRHPASDVQDRPGQVGSTDRVASEMINADIYPVVTRATALHVRAATVMETMTGTEDIPVTRGRTARMTLTRCY